MHKIEGIIFDWAGTTLDFGCFAPVDVFVRMFKQAGIDVTVAEAREPMGMSKIDHVRTMLKMPRINESWQTVYGRYPEDKDVEELYAVFETQLMATLKDYTDPIPGVIETIEKLRVKGMKIGSTTGYTREMMDVVVREAAEKGYRPDTIMTSDDVGKMGRPFPYMIFRNMEALKLTHVRQVIKVGDTVSDMKEAKAAGVITVGVVIGSSEMGLTEAEWNQCTTEEKSNHIERVKVIFRSAGADYTIDSMEELPGLVQEIEGQLQLVD